jgi:hypothetical protein
VKAQAGKIGKVKQLTTWPWYLFHFSMALIGFAVALLGKASIAAVTEPGTPWHVVMATCTLTAVLALSLRELDSMISCIYAAVAIIAYAVLAYMAVGLANIIV